MTRQHHPLVLALLLFLAACSGPPGGEFLGKWGKPNGEEVVFEIVQNGASFLVVDPSEKGKSTQEKFPATLAEDGTLHMQTPLGKVVLSHVKDTDTIATMGAELRRMK